MNRQQLNSIMDIVSDVILDSGFDCIEAEWNQHDRVLRLFVDHEDGVDLTSCVKVNKLLVDHEEVDKLIPENSMLEVSSPGVERPLRKIQHFEKFIGSKAKIRLIDKVLERRQETGRLVAVDGNNVTLETDGGDWWVFPIEKLHKAHLLFEWNNK